MTTKTLPITKARINLGSIIEQVRTKNQRFILEKGGIPVATIVSIDTIEDLLDTLEIVRAREETKNEQLIDWNKIRNKYT